MDVNNQDWTSQVRSLQKVVNQSLCSVLTVSEATGRSLLEPGDGVQITVQDIIFDIILRLVLQVPENALPETIRVSEMSVCAALMGKGLAVLGDHQTDISEKARDQTLQSVSPLFEMMSDLAKFIDGDYDGRAQQAEVRRDFMQKALRLQRGVQEALNRCDATTTVVTGFEWLVNMTYDQGLVPLKSKALALQQHKTQQAESLRSQIQTLSTALSSRIHTLEGLQKQLQEAQRGYEESKTAADVAKATNILLWVFCWPAALAMQLECTNKLSNQLAAMNGTVEAAKRSLEDTQGLADQLECDLAQSYSRFAEAQALVQRLGPISILIEGMQRFAGQLLGCLAELKTRLQSVQTEIGRILADASSAKYGQSEKAAIARTILQMLDHSLVDVGLVPMAGQVLGALHGAGPASLWDQVQQHVERLKGAARRQDGLMSGLVVTMSS